MFQQRSRLSAVCVKAEADPLDEMKGQVKARLGELAQNIDDPILKQAVKVRLRALSEVITVCHSTHK